MILAHKRLITESEDLHWSYSECFIHVVLEAQHVYLDLIHFSHSFFSLHLVAVCSRAPAAGVYLLNDTYGQNLIKPLPSSEGTKCISIGLCIHYMKNLESRISSKNRQFLCSKNESITRSVFPGETIHPRRRNFRMAAKKISLSSKGRVSSWFLCVPTSHLVVKYSYYNLRLVNMQVDNKIYGIH